MAGLPGEPGATRSQRLGLQKNLEMFSRRPGEPKRNLEPSPRLPGEPKGILETLSRSPEEPGDVLQAPRRTWRHRLGVQGELAPLSGHPGDPGRNLEMSRLPGEPGGTWSHHPGFQENLEEPGVITEASRRTQGDPADTVQASRGTWSHHPGFQESLGGTQSHRLGLWRNLEPPGAITRVSRRAWRNPEPSSGLQKNLEMFSRRPGEPGRTQRHCPGFQENLEEPAAIMEASRGTQEEPGAIVWSPEEPGDVLQAPRRAWRNHGGSVSLPPPPAQSAPPPSGRSVSRLDGYRRSAPGAAGSGVRAQARAGRRRQQRPEAGAAVGAAGGAGAMSSTSQKHRDFVAEPMGEKPVGTLAGIGDVLGKKLEDKGFDKAYVVLGQFLVLRKDEELFREWLKETCGANAKQARDCAGCLREWCDAFL